MAVKFRSLEWIAKTIVMEETTDYVYPWRHKSDQQYAAVPIRKMHSGHYHRRRIFDWINLTCARSICPNDYGCAPFGDLGQPII